MPNTFVKVKKIREGIFAQVNSQSLIVEYCLNTLDFHTRSRKFNSFQIMKWKVEFCLLFSKVWKSSCQRTKSSSHRLV